jgi:hypothetical protein
MTKQGYTHIIVPTELHAQLKALAKEDKVSIAQKIAHLINAASESSINTNRYSINTTQLLQQKQDHNHAFNTKKLSEINQNAFSLSTGSLFAKRESVVVLRPGFGPGSSARKAGILDRTILPEHMF